MHSDAAGAGIDPLNREDQVRILATEFTIRTNRSDLFERLAYLTQRAEQDFPVAERCTIDVMWDGEEYRISGGSEEDDFELSLSVAFERLFARLHNHALSFLSNHVRIHAASGRHKGDVFLIVGAKYAGKSTFAMNLLLERFDILGDELVLLEDGKAVTFPRKFYLRAPALALLPKLAGAWFGAPFTTTPQDGKLIALDPISLGRRWLITPGRISACVYLEPNHGGTSSISPCAKVDMIRRVLPQCTPPASGRPDWLADLCGSINRAETATITLGDLDSATIEFRRFLG